MSWSINSTGLRPAVEAQVVEAAKSINLADAGEMETATRSVALIGQALAVMSEDMLVKVEAYGSMGYRDWGAKTGAYQSLCVKVEPIHQTT